MEVLLFPVVLHGLSRATKDGLRKHLAQRMPKWQVNWLNALPIAPPHASTLENLGQGIDRHALIHLVGVSDHDEGAVRGDTGATAQEHNQATQQWPVADSGHDHPQKRMLTEVRTPVGVCSVLSRAPIHSAFKAVVSLKW